MRWWTLDELERARIERDLRPLATWSSGYVGLLGVSLRAVEEVIVIVHLLAAAVWFGGSVALVFAGVPAIRMLEGEPRGRAMKELGLRWRPLGYGSLHRRGAHRRRARPPRLERGPLAVPDRALGKVALSVGLVTASYLHNFVLGPRLQAEIREGRAERRGRRSWSSAG